jgi:hypothetical protein
MSDVSWNEADGREEDIPLKKGDEILHSRRDDYRNSRKAVFSVLARNDTMKSMTCDQRRH